MNSDSNRSHDLEINSHNDYMNDVEMENGHIANGKFDYNLHCIKANLCLDSCSIVSYLFPGRCFV